MPQNDKALLTRLSEHKVEFVIIGGVCGVLHGALLVTLDLEAVKFLRGIKEMKNQQSDLFE